MRQSIEMQLFMKSMCTKEHTHTESQMHTGILVWRQAVVCAPGMCNLTSKLKLNLFTHLFSSEKDSNPPFPFYTHTYAHSFWSEAANSRAENHNKNII